MRRVPPPPPPPRQRSRSPVERRQRAVLEAHRRNRASNRGGRAARRRTRAIHRQLLEILLERVLRIIRQLAFAVASERRQWDLRYRQVQERLNYLSREDTFPESKHIVLPNLRSWVAEQPDIREEADRLSIESESVQETVSLPVSRSESETEAEAQTPPPLLVRLTASRASTLAGVSVTRNNPLLRQQLASPTASLAAPSTASPTPPKANPPTQRPPQVDLTVHRPPQVDLTVQRPPLLALTPERVGQLEARHHLGRRPIPANTKLILSWDFHQVLDCFRYSNTRKVHCQQGWLPQEVRSAVADLQSDQICQVVVSYCHNPDTVQNVLRHTLPQAEFSGVYITRKPDGPKGKLQLLLSLQGPGVYLAHVDDSPEVLSEIQNHIESHPYCGLDIVGLVVPRKRQIAGVKYCRNVREIVDNIVATRRWH